MQAPPAVRSFEPGDGPAIRRIMLASLATDDIPGFSAHEIERAIARLVPDPGGTVVALEGDTVVGYCTPRHNDLTVDPARRRRGHGRRLAKAALDLVRARGDPWLNLYVPAHLPASRAFAEALGLHYRSSLWQFRLPADVAVPAPSFPAEVATRPYGDEDVDAWVAFIAASFEGHPTPMILNADVVRAVNARPDFDPNGILIVSPSQEPAAPIAFARVELMPNEDEPTAPIGYVNMIGVLPVWRGQGLGRELLRWSVAYLRGRGAGRIDLSVEAENEHATALYRRHGFEPTIEWPNWALSA